MIDIENAKVDEYVVCLIDVLGLKDKFKNWCAVEVERPATLEPIISSVIPVCHFHEMFNDFFVKVESGRTLEVLKQSFPESEVARYLQCTEYKLGQQWFSDTFVFYAPTFNSSGNRSAVPVYYLLMTCCLAMLDSLFHRHPVRGAICVGMGIELTKNNFFGPAFAEAYSLEREVAGYPRVIVSAETLQCVDDVGSQHVDDPISQKIKQLAGLCSTLVTRDTDGEYIVDYLGKGIYDYTSPEERGKLTVAVRAIYEFVISEWRRFRGDGNRKLALRYHLLREYIESRLPLWGIKEQ